MEILDELGLTSDRTVSLLTDSVWESLTPVIEKWKGSITAAIAYVGSTGDVQLPLSQGCSLIVDASEHAVAGHMTNPHTLLRWHRAGVSLYSRPHLHAMMILAESLGGAAPFLVVGSANASQHSANVLEEAALVTDSIELIGQAREGPTLEHRRMRLTVARRASPIRSRRTTTQMVPNLASRRGMRMMSMRTMSPISVRNVSTSRRSRPMPRSLSPQPTTPTNSPHSSEPIEASNRQGCRSMCSGKTWSRRMRCCMPKVSM
ncbi:hypothetical protein GYA93_11840 [Gordonia desulfuricans]|uniref:Phospholipase D-like domain-containing protein n=1 Tax=Gordonia desulfuricans TaxID=89051 RepID=A0A7K3LPY0_9ACTN|nr:hypothetical protein [Gordonia desulfuricans]NDK90268.1 hypothetical protein [Gordonia desulfuricans]